MAACQCPGCGGHAAWVAEQREKAADELAVKTARFEYWLKEQAGTTTVPETACNWTYESPCPVHGAKVAK